MFKVTLTLDEQGNLVDVKPENESLNVMKKTIGVDWTSNGTIDNVTTVAILSKPGYSPCCIITGGEAWCWC